MDTSRTSAPSEGCLIALKLARREEKKERKKVLKQHTIYSSSTPCSLWPFVMSVETLSDLRPYCLNSKYQCSIKPSAHILENEQPLVFHSITCSNNTCRLLFCNFPIALLRSAAYPWSHLGHKEVRKRRMEIKSKQAIW